MIQVDRVHIEVILSMLFFHKICVITFVIDQPIADKRCPVFQPSLDRRGNSENLLSLDVVKQC